MTNENATPVPAKTITVRMDDGRDVEFGGKRKMLKTTTIDETTSEVIVRMDFVNGETRTYNIVKELLLRFAAHGAEQKLGDEIAGVEDVEDAIVAIDTLLIRLEKGEWNAKRDSNGTAGASTLAKALMELTGKDKAAIMVFLSGKSHAEKIALRANPKLESIVKRIEAEKAARSTKKGASIDSDALLAGLDVGGAAPEAEAAGE